MLRLYPRHARHGICFVRTRQWSSTALPRMRCGCSASTAFWKSVMRSWERGRLALVNVWRARRPSSQILYLRVYSYSPRLPQDKVPGYSNPLGIVKVQCRSRLKSQHEAVGRPSADADGSGVGVGRRSAAGSAGATSVACQGDPQPSRPG